MGEKQWYNSGDRLHGACQDEEVLETLLDHRDGQVYVVVGGQRSEIRQHSTSGFETKLQGNKNNSITCSVGGDG